MELYQMVILTAWDVFTDDTKYMFNPVIISGRLL